MAPVRVAEAAMAVNPRASLDELPKLVDPSPIQDPPPRPFEVARTA